MAIISKPVSADLRCLNVDRKVMQRFTRIKNDIDGNDARLLQQAVQMVQDVPVTRTLVTIASELAVEE